MQRPEGSANTSRGQRRRPGFWMGLALTLLIASVAMGRAWIFHPVAGHPGSYFNRGTNAAWLGVEWVKEPHSAQEIAALGRDLSRLQIKYVFIYTSYLRPEGRFNPTYDYMKNFVTNIKQIYPALHIQAWIGLPLEYVNLGDETTRRKIINFCVHIIRTTGVDGIHLDPEPIPTDDENVLALLDELRNALGSEATLSIAARRIWPILPDLRWPLVGRVAWRAGYYREIARRVNQIAVMTYDSAIPSADLYRLWTRLQVVEISHAVGGTEVQLFFGIPTSEEATWTHRPWAENMESGLRGVIDGLNDPRSDPRAVAGVAIYPYWETDAKEWRIYEALWLGRSDTGR